MKKTFYITASILLLAGVLSCRKETAQSAKAVLATSSEISFEAKDPEASVITVYSDAQWTADVPSWISIEPATGSGTVNVTVSADANYVGGEMGSPRTDTLVFHGSTILSRCYVIVKQNGDSYRDAPKVNVSDLAAVADGKAVSLLESQVMAISTDGAVISDGKAYAFAYGLQSRTLGDKLTAKGLKSSTGGIPTLGSLERIEARTGTAVQPTAKDISAGITAYEAKAMECVFVKGLLKVAAGGGYNVVTDMGDAAYVYNPTAGFKTDELTGHNVELTGYSFGKKGAASVNVVASALVDKGKPGPDPGVKGPELPVSWKITVADNFNQTWPCDKTAATVFGKNGMICSTTGTGTIWFNNEKGFAADGGKGNAYLDIPKEIAPRVSGAWTGDYCEFRVPGEISKGRTVRITFETRSAKKGAKYWRLKYLDGTEYQDACQTQTVSVEGTDIVYSHEMNSNGETNIQVDAIVTYKADTQDIVFRFECQSPVSANGDMQKAPTGTWRLSVTDTSSDEWQPTIRYAE